MDDLRAFTLPAGSVCSRNGIPFVLSTDVVILCHPNNWELMGIDGPSIELPPAAKAEG